MTRGKAVESGPTGLGLLMFNLGDNEGILRNARDLSDLVDEIVVVDSSLPAVRDRLARDLQPLGGRVVPVIPLGFGDSVRAFGLAQMRSERVLSLDADEQVSRPLRDALPFLTGSDGYVVPRLEQGLGSFTYHLRLFRRDRVRFQARSFDFPSVDGPVDHLDRTQCILHTVDYRGYLEKQGRGERYFAVEHVERPYLRAYLRETLTLRLGARGVSLPGVSRLATPSDVPLSGPMIRLIIEWEFLRDLALGKGLRTAKFNRMYSLEKWDSFRNIPSDRQLETLAIAREVQQAGGLLDYLSLEDPGYLTELTRSFRWDRKGLEVFQELLRFRHERGRRMEVFQAPRDVRGQAERGDRSGSSLSVVIPTHNRPERLFALLESLATNPPAGLQSVIVVDDSEEPTDVAARFPGLPVDHLRLEGRVFITHAKNLGWLRARTDFVYFIDDDNVVTQETFTGPVAAMDADPTLGAVVPAVLYRRQPGTVWVYATPWSRGRWGHSLLGRNQPRSVELEGQLLDTDALPNASLVRRSAFEQTGGFSEDLVVNSSADAAMRLKCAGWKVRAHTGAFIYHDVDPPGEFGYWARHGAADPERVYHEVRDWFLLMRSVHANESWFRVRATVHALGFMLPNGTTYLLQGGARGRSAVRNLIWGYLGGLRATSRRS